MSFDAVKTPTTIRTATVPGPPAAALFPFGATIMRSFHCSLWRFYMADADVSCSYNRLCFWTLSFFFIHYSTPYNVTDHSRHSQLLADFQCVRVDIVSTVSFLEQNTAWILGSASLMSLAGRHKKPRGLFNKKNPTTFKMTTPLCHSQNPLVFHEYPRRLMTFSKLGCQAMCQKIKPELRTWRTIV